MQKLQQNVGPFCRPSLSSLSRYHSQSLPLVYRNSTLHFLSGPDSVPWNVGLDAPPSPFRNPSRVRGGIPPDPPLRENGITINGRRLHVIDESAVHAFAPPLGENIPPTNSAIMIHSAAMTTPPRMRRVSFGGEVFASIVALLFPPTSPQDCLFFHADQTVYFRHLLSSTSKYSQ